MTKIILRLLPAPPANKTVIAVFNDIAIAGEAVSDIISAGVLPSKLEFVDSLTMKRYEDLFPSGLPADTKLLLLIQVDGLPETVEAEAQQIVEICKRGKAGEVNLAKDQAEALRIWQARSALFSDLASLAHTILTEDVAVPRDRLAEFIRQCQEKARIHDVTIGFSGHAGDGNIHPAVLTDNRDEEHYKRALECVDDIIDMALSLGGVLSGEHGIGLEKQRFLRKAMDPVAINIMKKIKDVLDPNHILNPGKVWEEASNGD